MRIRLTPITWFVILALLAVILALGLPPDPHAVQQLHTTPSAYRLAIAALLIPYVLIWYSAFYAFAKLQEYSRPLKKTKDGAAFHTVTAGMGTLAFSVVVPTIIGLILNNIAAHHPSFKSASVIIENYLGLFPSLIAFLLLFNGARILLRSNRGAAEKLDVRWQAPWFLLLCVTFSLLAFDNQNHTHPYHLPTWLLVVTIIVPYLYGWLVGLLGAYSFGMYAKTVPGVVYQQAVKLFAKGIVVTIAGSIAIQFVNSVVMQRARNSLGMILVLDILLLIILAAGLILMALGAKKLKRIEEI